MASDPAGVEVSDEGGAGGAGAADDACGAEVPQVRRLVLSPVWAARLATATARRQGCQRLLLPVRWALTAPAWYLRLAWYAGSTGVLTSRHGVLAYSGAPDREPRPDFARAATASAAAAVLLAGALGGGVLIAVVVAQLLGGAELAASVLTVLVLALASVAMGCGWYLVAWPIRPNARYDRVTESLAGRTGWQIRCLAATGPCPAEEEGALLRRLVEVADERARPVLAGRVLTRDRAVLEKLEERQLPGPPRRWPELRVHGTLEEPGPLAETLTLRANWSALGGFSVLASSVTALVALIAVRGVLPAERAARTCQDTETSGGCMQDWADALYWGATTVTTTGYGDLHPHSSVGRSWAVVLMLTGVFVVAGFIVSLSTTALLRSVDRREQVLQHVRHGAVASPDERLARVELLLQELVSRSDTHSASSARSGHGAAAGEPRAPGSTAP